MTGTAQTLKEPLAQALPGEWKNLYVRIHIKDKVVEADSSNWEERLHIKPIHTWFNKDGSYRSEYRNLQDSLVRVSSGSWSIEGDTLTMDEATPEVSHMKFHLLVEKDIASFSGLIDFDGDGKANDLYYGRQRKCR
jgi:hypothetical protein